MNTGFFHGPTSGRLVATWEATCFRCGATRVIRRELKTQAAAVLARQGWQKSPHGHVWTCNTCPPVVPRRGRGRPTKG